MFVNSEFPLPLHNIQIFFFPNIQIKFNVNPTTIFYLKPPQ